MRRSLLPRTLALLTIGAALVSLTGCGGSSSGVATPTVTAAKTYELAGFQPGACSCFLLLASQGLVEHSLRLRTRHDAYAVIVGNDEAPVIVCGYPETVERHGISIVLPAAYTDDAVEAVFPPGQSIRYTLGAGLSVTTQPAVD